MKTGTSTFGSLVVGVDADESREVRVNGEDWWNGVGGLVIGSGSNGCVNEDGEDLSSC